MTCLARRAATALAIGGAALMALGTASVAANPAPVRSAPAADSLPEAKAVKEYWTPRRMRLAEPRDVTLTPRDVARAAVTARPPGRGKAGSVPPTTGASATSGKVRIRRANLVGNPSRYPYRTQGKVFFRWRGGDYVCSATTVNTPTKRVIFTAGHCVIDEGTRSSRLAFVPGYTNGSRPYGTFVATKLFWIKPWAQNGNFSYDMAAAVLGGARKVGQVVGTRGIKWNLPRRQNFVSYGYPAGLPYNGEQLYSCPGPYRGQDPSTSHPRTQWITCDMTGGASGGGWIVGGRFLNSVNSYGYLTQPNRMYGPYFGAAAQRLYNRVKNQAP
jgi:V8-like Glu-specific endopeptidase